MKLTLAIVLALSSIASAQSSSRYPCAGPHALTAATLYSATAGHGFDLNTVPSAFDQGACASDKPFFFSLAAPDGNYQITLVLGGSAASTTTVRAESRRLMVDKLAVSAKGSKTVTFNVNVRSASIYPSTDAKPSTEPPPQVRLKPLEIGALDWDEKLTLEFNGDHPSVRSITIKPVKNIPTIYLAGDSTVVDQDKEPWAAWGQMLPAFFTSAVSISNQAESGETIRSFVSERRLAKIESTMRAGDYLLIQFAHNDQKPGTGLVTISDYKDLLRRYIAETRALGATPILVTSMNRRNFDADGKIVQTLGEYPQAMRDVATEQKTALIDLNALSKILFEAMGEAGTLHAFVHYPANTFPDQPAELKDDTHFNSYGAYELTRAIVQSICDQKLPLAHYLRPDIAPFDPAHPDAFDTWTLPPSPSVSAATPYGR